MRICVLTTRHEAGDDRVYYKETVSLAERFGEVTLLAPGGRQPIGLHPRVTSVPLTPAKGALGLFLRLIEAVRLIRTIKPDVCHFHDPELLLVAPLLRGRGRSKLIYDSHEATSEAVRISTKLPRLMRPAAAVLVDFLEKRISARCCDLIVTADDATKATFGRTGCPVVTVFNYPRLELFRERQDLERSLQERYLGKIVAIYHGSMGKERGLFHMIYGLAATKKIRPRLDLILVLLGLADSQLKTEVLELADRLSVRSMIDVVPWIDHRDVAAYIRRAKIGIVPWQPAEKHRMNIPIKVFEYMCCGVPVLGANLPTIAHYLLQSGAGRVYDSTSSEDFANRFVEMIEDEQGWRAMSQKGYEHTAESWNWNRMEEVLLAAYSTLLTSADKSAMYPDRKETP